jgi:predicted HicB family RNase H-like nuclease
MDGKRATTLRIDPEQLEALKILAAKRRVKVNDLVLEGVEHVLALHAGKL